MSNRIVVICHPNPTRVDVVLTGKRFNNEQYSFSRKHAATGHEERLLERLNNVNGVEEARTSKNTLSLEICEGFHTHEILPAVLALVEEFAGPDFTGPVYLDERRESVSTCYDDDGWMSLPGVKITGANIGVPYEPWVAE